MKISEISLSEFDFWGPAKEVVSYLTNEELKYIEQTLEDINDDINDDKTMLNKTELNDLFAYREDVIASILGYHDFEQLIEDRTSSKI